jgi:uncharacterized protein involved in exopolysaccharide biosynthesis
MFRNHSRLPCASDFIGNEAGVPKRAIMNEAGDAPGELGPMLAPGEAEPDLAQIVETLRRRSGLVIATTLAALGLAGAYLAAATPKYVAATSLLIDARQRAPLGSEAQPLGSAPDIALIDSQLKVIGSEAVLRRVVEAERLDLDPIFASTGGGLRQSLLRAAGVSKAAPAAERADKAGGALRALAEALTVKRSERTYVVDVEVATADPVKSARLADAVAQAYVADLRGSSAEVARRNSDWIKTRIVELQSKVEQDERRIADFRAKHGLLDANGRSVNDSDLADVSAQLTGARARVAETKARYEQIKRIAASGLTPDGLGEATRSGALDRLRGQLADIQRQESNVRSTLGPRHPAYVEVQQQLADVRRAIRDEARRLVDMAQSDYMAARAQEQAASGRVEAAKAQTNLDGKAMVELRDLEREVAASRAAYERFLRARETVHEDVAEGPLARVISPAVAPASATSPKKGATILLALAGGLGLGVAAALLADLFSRRRAGASPASTREAAREEPIVAPAPHAEVFAAHEAFVRERARAQFGPAFLDPEAQGGEEERDRRLERRGDAAKVRSGPGDDAEPAGGGRRGEPSEERVMRPAPIAFDPSLFEDGLFDFSGAVDPETRLSAEVDAWRLIDAVGGGDGAPKLIAIVDLSARRREGLALRMTMALARAAAGRGDRVLARAGRPCAHFDAFAALAEARALDLEGERVAVTPIDGEGGPVWLAAPEGARPSARARTLDPRRSVFDLMLIEAEAGDPALRACDGVAAVVGASDDAAAFARAHAALASRGARLVGVLTAPERPRRRGRRAA